VSDVVRDVSVLGQKVRVNMSAFVPMRECIGARATAQNVSAFVLIGAKNGDGLPLSR
jgi:hypothetical protein